jgi:hypothetical protein
VGLESQGIARARVIIDDGCCDLTKPLVAEERIPGKMTSVLVP